MNRKAIGQIITSGPAIIIVVIIMLFFVIISSIMAKEHYESYSLNEDFLKGYLVYEGKVMTIANLIDDSNICAGSFPFELGVKFREYFNSRFGHSNLFAIVKDPALPGIDFEVYSWSGFMEEKYEENYFEISSSELENIFDSKSDLVEIKRICSSTSFYLYTKKGGFSS